VLFERGIFFEVFYLGERFSAHVDVYNASSDSWTSNPAGLGQARSSLAAASLPSGLVFFAGGILGISFVATHMCFVYVVFCSIFALSC
jgi:hypothetical protein